MQLDLVFVAIMESLKMHKKRHYKKDSMYVFDLYTLTYDNHESLDNIIEYVSFYVFVFNMTHSIFILLLSRYVFQHLHNDILLKLLHLI